MGTGKYCAKNGLDKKKNKKSFLDVLVLDKHSTFVKEFSYFNLYRNGRYLYGVLYQSKNMKQFSAILAFLITSVCAFGQGQAGIGALLEVRYDSTTNSLYPYVKSLAPGYPAEKVLRVGDAILKIDNYDPKGEQNESEIREKHMKGADSSMVELVVRRGDTKTVEKVSIMRKVFNNTSNSGVCIGNCVNGTGVWTSPTGDKYDGTFKRGVLEGIGKITSGVGDKFEGTFQGGKKEGIGKLIKKSGETWDGNYANDLGNGFFKIKYVNGDNYEGDVTNGAVTGKGKKTFKSGEIWDGQWLNGQLGGYAKCTYKNGDTYEGMFSGGKKNGWGKFVKLKGFAYDGMFKADRRVGYGQYIYTEITPNRRIEGEFASERCKKGIVFYEPDENKVWKYEGDLDFESRPLNNGKIYYRDGKWEEGKFENGKLSKQTAKGAMALNDTKTAKFSDKEVPAAVERVITDIEGKLKTDGYELETKVVAKANAFATLSGKEGYTYVVAALTTAKATLFYGTIGNKEKAEMPTQTASDDKVRLLYQIRDGNGTPMFTTASSFVKGSEAEVTLLVYKKRK